MRARCFLCPVLVVALPLIASADRLIMIPTGNKVFINTLKLDGSWSLTNSKRNQVGVRLPIGQSMDAEIVGENGRNGKTGAIVSASYQLLVPIIDVVPGFSVGVRDITNRGRSGRAGYVSATFKFGQEGTYNQDTPVELTLGVGVGSLRGPFAGTVLPFADSFRLIGEYDTRNFTAGLEVRPLRPLAIQWLFREHETRLHVTWTMRW